jgi:ABC-type polysaccharide/polyol phosphate transport system ATPase subunit
MEPAIEIVGVTKRFRRHTEPNKSIKERLLYFRKNEVKEFDALHDIDLDVAQGETIGLLGHNGSGKSTLLKCIAGTIRPTTGEIRVRGRMAAMLELGAGFHPDLTGRENVFLNGSILGFSREHVTRIFDEIVAFAELEEFIDQQVKYYSSGMYARLGFAVAVNLEPDVLLVDEVLAVGDENFQRKCLERVRRFQTEGRTIVLVTHSPDQVIQLCDRALVLDHGHALHVGDTAEAVRVFRHALHASSAAHDPAAAAAEAVAAAGALSIVGARATGPDGTDTVRPGDPVTVELRYLAKEPVPAARARIVLTTHDGVQMLNASTFDLLGHDLFEIEGEGTVRFCIERMPLLDGTYRVGLVLQDPAETFQYDQDLDACTFDVYTGQPITGRVELAIQVEHTTGQPTA